MDATTTGVMRWVPTAIDASALRPFNISRTPKSANSPRSAATVKDAKFLMVMNNSL
jgi:hypothetical protein